MKNIIEKKSKIFVAGGSGMVGSSIVRILIHKGYKNVIYPKRSDLDLFDLKAVSDFLIKECPDQIILAAARVGGIETNNNNKHLFLYENLKIQNNIIFSSHENNVKNLMFLGSSCVYPNNFLTPIKEEDLLSGPLEPTNEGYSLAKICGIKLCNYISRDFENRNYFSVMPCNLFGENDNFSSETSHVIPALLKKFHRAKINNNESVVVWGTGNAKREFMHVDDLAEACIDLMNADQCYDIINIGTSVDIKISQLVSHIKEVTGFKGKIIYDTSKKEGTLRKILSTERINSLGWHPKRKFIDELKKVYNSAIKRNLL
tara:strand:+ start:2546 stop:3493 length:948 start_codon:yes stop_codon:yes gene_type:complete